MTIHNLKTWPEYFQAVWDGLKPWEYRRNDRDYHVGDILFLEEWKQESKAYTGRRILAEVIYILADGMGLADMYAILSIKVLEWRG